MNARVADLAVPALSCQLRFGYADELGMGRFSERNF
jgi:hypothetical protein